MITTYLVALSLLITIHAYSAPAVDGAHFLETFQDASWADRWIITENKEFEGEWIVRENDEPIGIEGDKGLVAANEAKKHGIAVEFDSALDTTGETLVVQYEVRTQKSLSCGGAYIKLLRKETMPSELSAFDNTTPYTIMFGPDKCGADSKVHFIFNHKNPKTGEYEEKHMTDRPQMKANTLSHLYTLVVNSDNTFQVLIDMEEVRSGSLLEDFEPSVNPPKEIDDPTDKKPDTWVDAAQIPDPEAVKPDDWDEDAPAEIEDKDAVKPDDWLDDGELEIPDPDASKPEDWDDELDGDWDAPLVPNPQCAKVGCGEWKPPTIPNPEYKGKWSAPMIENPDYIGEWKPKQIPNPNYFEDGQPSNFEAIGGIGIEIWTMSKDILFDNVLVTSDKDAADAFAKKTWLVRHYEEDRKYIDMNKPPSPSLQAQFEEILANTLVFIQENPAIIAATALIGLVPIALCFMGGSKPKRGEDVPEEEDEDEDEEPLLPKKEEKKVKKTRSRTRRDVD